MFYLITGTFMSDIPVVVITHCDGAIILDKLSKCAEVYGRLDVETNVDDPWVDVGAVDGMSCV